MNKICFKVLLTASLMLGAVIFEVVHAGRATVLDTLTWWDENDPGILDTVRFDPGDSVLAWFDPSAPCSLVSIRVHWGDWTGDIAFDIWDAGNYDPLVYSADSTDSNGWWGTFDPLECGSCWVPGLSVHSPLGCDVLDPSAHPWGPLPYTVTESQSNSIIEIRAACALQGEVDLGDCPFFVGVAFCSRTDSGLSVQQTTLVPYHSFEFYSSRFGPDGIHDGWFVRSHLLRFEAIVRYYELIPDIRITAYELLWSVFCDSGFTVEFPDQLLKLYNDGNGTLEIFDISTDDSAFFVTPHSLTIDCMDSSEVTVGFDPPPNNCYPSLHCLGKLTINSNDPDEPVSQVPLVGELGSVAHGPRGDATGDGRMDVLDVLAIANDILGLKKITGDAI